MMKYSIQGQQVQRLCFDYAVSIETSDGAVLRIETPFQLSQSGEDPFQTVDPEHLEQSGSSLFSLINGEIGSASISDWGALSIRFAKGQLLLCEPNSQFEAWSIASPSGEQMVCLPGGGVAVWPEVQGS